MMIPPGEKVPRRVIFRREFISRLGVGMRAGSRAARQAGGLDAWVGVARRG